MLRISRRSNVFGEGVAAWRGLTDSPLPVDERRYVGLRIAEVELRGELEEVVLHGETRSKFD